MRTTIARGAFAALAVLALAAPRAAAQVVDLEAVAIVAPGVLNAGAPNTVTAEVRSSEPPPADGFRLDVVLSSDGVVDDLDPRIGGMVVAKGGVYTVKIAPFVSIASGAYHIGLRVPPADGEVNLANNVLLGAPLQLIHVSAKFVDPAPIVVQSSPLEPSIALELAIHNPGDAGGIAVFEAYTEPPVSWLQLAPASGVLVGQGPIGTLSLILSPAGLGTGSHSTTLVLQDSTNPAAKDKIVLSYVMGAVGLAPGDRIVAALDAGERHEFAFQAVPGMRLSVKTENASAPLAISIVDPMFNALQAPPIAAKTKSKHLFKLTTAGTLLLRIQGQGNGPVSYALKTGRKLPKTAKARKVVLDAAHPQVGCAMLQGGMLEILAQGNKAVTGPLGLLLEAPGGVPMDVASALSTPAEGSLQLSGLVVPGSGMFQITLEGFGSAKKARATVKLAPQQPPLGTATILVP